MNLKDNVINKRTVRETVYEDYKRLREKVRRFGKVQRDCRSIFSLQIKICSEFEMFRKNRKELLSITNLRASQNIFSF